MPGILLSKMPSRSKVILYGTLSKEDLSEISPLLLIGRDQKIESFFLGQYLKTKYVWNILSFLGRVQKFLYDATLHTQIRKTVSLEEMQDAVEEYKTVMGGGKILCAPNGTE